MTESQPTVASPNEHQRPPALRFNGRMTRLGEMLKLYRAVHHMSIRDCADEIGVPYTTLNRFETTDAGMTADSFIKILFWLLTPAKPLSPKEAP